MINKLFTLRALSSIHCGIGQGLNDIDLPTARNKVTGHPIIPASSIKGVMKDEFQLNGLGKKSAGIKNIQDWKLNAKTLFGGDEACDFASAISVGDANLLALPVRSFFGTFAYLASPYTLQQLKQQQRRLDSKQSLPAIPQINRGSNNYRVMLSSESVLRQQNNNSILLEELDLVIDDENIADDWAKYIARLYFDDEEGQQLFIKRFAIVDDNAINFLCESALPVDARIAIDDETGTVKPGALWYEESVPPETLFSGVIGIDNSHNKEDDANDTELAAFLTASPEIYLQIGGKATTGKGFVAIRFTEAGA